MVTVLTIGGSDPTGGAGVQADLQTMASLGAHGAAVVTALTVQDTIKYSITVEKTIINSIRELCSDSP